MRETRDNRLGRLGRNPFDKKPARASVPAPARAIDFIREMEERPTAASPETEPEKLSTKFATKLARFLLVDVRAESYLLGLKAYLLSLSIFD